MSFDSKKGPSQRQQRVGEEIRHILAEVFLRGISPEVRTSHITVTEVRISPDLKHATAYIMPLGGIGKEGLVDSLKPLLHEIRAQVTRKINLKFSPRIFFKLDDSFDEAERIEKLLKSPQVQRDLHKDSEE